MAAFHLCVDATIKKEQQKLEVLADIGAIQALKECASSPDELPAKFASEALTVIGEQVPYKLSQQVPCWSIKDVQYWVEKVNKSQPNPTLLYLSTICRLASAHSVRPSHPTWWTAICCCC